MPERTTARGPKAGKARGRSSVGQRMTITSTMAKDPKTAGSSSSGGRAPQPHSSAQWLHVAFWKKPHLLDDHGLHGGPSSSSSSVQEGDTANMLNSPSREMQRTLGLFDLIMIGIGGTVGSGVFATAGLIASVYAGPAAILSWLIAGLGCILSGLSFMELSCLIPSAGSTYAYAYHALGELPAMFAGFLLTLEYGVSSAGGARSWSDKFTTWMESQWHITGPEWMKPKDSVVDLYAGLLMTLCVGVVLCGMQAGKVLVNVVTMTKISVVLFIIVAGFMNFDADNLSPFVPESSSNDKGQVVFGWPGVFLGASASFFGYIGYDEVCCLAGEAKNPTRNIPRAVIGTIVGAAVLSTLATFALVGMQKYTDIDSAESYGKALEHNGWPWAAAFVATGEVFTMPITTFIGFMAQPRVQYAMAKDGLLPAAFARVDSKGNLFQGTLLCGIVTIIIATLVPFKILWNFISLGILVAFNLTNSSLLLVRAKHIPDQESAPIDFKRLHAYLIGAYLITSFLAAFHWQKSVIAFVPVDVENGAEATLFDKYMDSCGAVMAGLFTIIAVGITLFLKYLESASRNSLPTPTTPSPSSSSSPTTPPGTPPVSPTTETTSTSSDPTAGEEDDVIVLTKEALDADRPQQALRKKHLHGNHGDDAVEDCDYNDEDDSAAYNNSHNSSLYDVDMGSEDDDNNGKPQTFQAPFVPFAPCLAIFFNWFLFSQMDASSVWLILLWLLLAIVVYVSYSMHRSLAHQQIYYSAVNRTDRQMP